MIGLMHQRAFAGALLLISGLVGVHAAELKSSGFLEDVPKLESDADRKGAMVWNKPDSNLGGYDKIAIDSIEVWYDPDAENKGINPDQLKTFTDAFRETIIDALEPDYPVVTKAGDGVLRIRLAVTNVRTRKQGLKLYHIGITGIGMAILEESSGKSILVDKAMLEAELLDSQTGDRLAVLIDPHPQLVDPSQSSEQSGGGLTAELIPGSEPSWPNLKKTMAFYAKRLRDRLDKAHGK